MLLFGWFFVQRKSLVTFVWNLNEIEDMEKDDVIAKNVHILSEVSPEERRMQSKCWCLPSVEDLQHIVDLSTRIIFPGYFDKNSRSEKGRYYHIGVDMSDLRTLLREQIAKSFLAFCGECKSDEESDALALQFIDTLPELKRVLYTDVDAMFHSDPAVTAYSEIILCYPIVQVMIHHRIAHALLKLGVPVIPRIISEMAHSKTGIDIHPGAQIGEYFCIDHGTGVVVGETCIIGKHVMLYQGVTLGAKSFTFDEDGTPINTPRHPILEDYVTVYSNSSILGRVTIGHHTIVGGNVWLTNSVPPYSKILQHKADTLSFLDGAGI